VSAKRAPGNLGYGGTAAGDRSVQALWSLCNVRSDGQARICAGAQARGDKSFPTRRSLFGCCDYKQAVPTQHPVLGNAGLKGDVIAARVHPSEQANRREGFTDGEVDEVTVRVVGAQCAVTTKSADAVEVHAAVAKYQPYLLATRQPVVRGPRGAVVGQQAGYAVRGGRPILCGGGRRAPTPQSGQNKAAAWMLGVR